MGAGAETIGRRLAAIFAADVAGYARLIEADEDGTLSRLAAHRTVLDARIAAWRGRIANTAGDSVLAEFPSAVDAVRCAFAVQDELAAANALLPETSRLAFRIGVHVGDIVARGGDLFGDGVNIAARLQTLAEPGGVCLSAAAHDQVRKVVPADYRDLGAHALKNIAERVRVFAIDAPLASKAAPTAGKPLPLPDKPSLAVLPFNNMSGDPEQEYFADGITEDITTALSRLRWLFVIARNSAFTYKGKAVDVREVAREFGVRYVLEGSVRASGSLLRVTGQLIDAETGKHIWAEKYDRKLEDVFAVQDEITEHVVAAIEPHLYAEEGFRARNRSPDNLDSWGLVVRALTLINKVGRQQNIEAQDLLRRAIEIEPTYPRAHALLGWAKWWAAFAAWDEDRTRALAMARECAEKALALDPGDPWGRMVSGLVLSTTGSHDRAMGELEAAIRLNPSFALAHTVYGLVLLRAGRFEAAIDMTQKARRMSPADSFAGMYTSYHGLALLGARRFAEALPFLRASLAALPEFIGHYNTLISCCGHLGLIDEAKAYLDYRNRIGPPLSLGTLRANLRHFAHCEVFVEGLAKVGVAE